MATIDMENEVNNKGKGSEQSKGASGNAGSRSAAKEENASVDQKGMNAGATRASQPGSKQFDDAGVLSQVQETGRDLASKSLNAIGEKTRSTTEGYKSEITGGLHTLAEGLRQATASFNEQADDNAISSAGARYIGDLAGKIESVSGYFERKDAADLLQDVKGFARRNPTVFVGSAFALGFALSRFIRSGAAAPSTRG